jgi:hypothetical protein
MRKTAKYQRSVKMGFFSSIAHILLSLPVRDWPNMSPISVGLPLHPNAARVYGGAKLVAPLIAQLLMVSKFAGPDFWFMHTVTGEAAEEVNHYYETELSRMGWMKSKSEDSFQGGTGIASVWRRSALRIEKLHLYVAPDSVLAKEIKEGKTRVHLLLTYPGARRKWFR